MQSWRHYSTTSTQKILPPVVLLSLVSREVPNQTNPVNQWMNPTLNVRESYLFFLFWCLGSESNESCESVTEPNAELQYKLLLRSDVSVPNLTNPVNLWMNPMLKSSTTFCCALIFGLRVKRTLWISEWIQRWIITQPAVSVLMFRFISKNFCLMSSFSLRFFHCVAIFNNIFWSTYL